MLRHLLRVMFAVAITASAAPCQQRTEVPPGTRVRVSVPVFVDGVALNRLERPAVGTVVAIDSTSITAQMERDGALRTLPFSAITHLEVSRGIVSADEGRRKGIRRGAIMGTGVTATGVGLYYLMDVVFNRVTGASCNRPEPDTCAERFNSQLPYLVAAIGAGALGGGWVGMTLGARDRESWRRVSPRSLQPVGMPRDVSFTVSLKL